MRNLDQMLRETRDIRTRNNQNSNRFPETREEVQKADDDTRREIAQLIHEETYEQKLIGNHYR